MDSSETVGTITEQFERLIHMTFRAMKKKYGLFMVYRGLYYPIICGLIKHYKDFYETNQLLLPVQQPEFSFPTPTVPLNILTKTSQKHEEPLRRLIFMTCGSFKSKHCKKRG